MVRALDGGDGKCSSIHGTTSPLLASLRPGARALDREAGPVEARRLAGDSVAPAWAAACSRSVGDESRPHPRRAPRRRSAPSRGPARAGAMRHIAMKLFGRFANNLDRPQGNREVIPENAPAFA
jgi:hypothetical protein